MRLLLILLIIVVVAAVLVLIAFRLPRRTVVLGRQAAGAAARDAEHRRRLGDVPSPLPKQVYGREDANLIDPPIKELDGQLRAFCSRAAAATPVESASQGCGDRR